MSKLTKMLGNAAQSAKDFMASFLLTATLPYWIPTVKTEINEKNYPNPSRDHPVADFYGCVAGYFGWGAQSIGYYIAATDWEAPETLLIPVATNIISCLCERSRAKRKYKEQNFMKWNL